MELGWSMCPLGLCLKSTPARTCQRNQEKIERDVQFPAITSSRCSLDFVDGSPGFTGPLGRNVNAA